jgi:hypothetical protein
LALAFGNINHGHWRFAIDSAITVVGVFHRRHRQQSLEFSIGVSGLELVFMYLAAIFGVDDVCSQIEAFSSFHHASSQLSYVFIEWPCEASWEAFPSC